MLLCHVIKSYYPLQGKRIGGAQGRTKIKIGINGFLLIIGVAGTAAHDISLVAVVDYIASQFAYLCIQVRMNVYSNRFEIGFGIHEEVD